MPDCISGASSLVIILSWLSFILMIAGLGVGVKQQFPRKKLSPLLLLILAHPVLWSRGTGSCETPLWKSSIIFTVLGVLVFLWAHYREEIAESLDNLSD